MMALRREEAPVSRSRQAARLPTPFAGHYNRRVMSLDLRAKVAIVGVGCTQFGELYDRSAEDLLCDAVDEALADAGCERTASKRRGSHRDVDLRGRRARGRAEALRPSDDPRPELLRLRDGCLPQRLLAVAAGMHDVVLAVGFEKMRDGGFARPNRSHPVIDFGERAPHVFALSANRYFARYAPPEDARRGGSENHRHGLRSPKAHLRMEVNEATVLGAPMIYSPLGLFDCCPTTDAPRPWSSAAPISCGRSRVRPSGRSDRARGRFGAAVLQASFGYVGFEATVRAAEQAYAQAKVTPADVDFAEVHDCFTITEILTTRTWDSARGERAGSSSRTVAPTSAARSP